MDGGLVLTSCLCSLLSDMLLDDTSHEGAGRKEGRHVRIVVSLEHDDSTWAEVRNPPEKSPKQI